MARSVDEAEALADRVGYPVIVRPSFVIGGLAIDFAYSRGDLVTQLAAATIVDPDRPVRIDRYLEGVEVDVDAVADGETVLIPGLLEQIERAGVHSGDSVGVFPPQAVSEADQALIVSSMERIVRALGVRGLVNAQFIVREDGVYLIEVNPRASRTVPFMSKVTGVPLVDLAVRIALGQTLRELGWPNGLLPPPGFVAVKAPAFSTAKLRGVDPSLGPFMQSTGEVIGIHADARVATAKALLAASLVPPPGGNGALALLSVADRDKPLVPALATALARAGYRFAATSGTRAALGALGWDADAVAKLGQVPGPGEIAILDLIGSGTVRLVVNTPTPRSGPVRDAAEIRLAAIAEGVLCLTAMETAVAAAQALDPDLAERLSDVRPLDAWVPCTGHPAGLGAGPPDRPRPHGASWPYVGRRLGGLIPRRTHGWPAVGLDRREASSGPEQPSAVALLRPGALDEASQEHDGVSEPRARRDAARRRGDQPLALGLRAEPRHPVGDLGRHAHVPFTRPMHACSRQLAAGTDPVAHRVIPS